MESNTPARRPRRKPHTEPLPISAPMTNQAIAQILTEARLCKRCAANLKRIALAVVCRVILDYDMGDPPRLP